VSSSLTWFLVFARGTVSRVSIEMPETRLTIVIVVRDDRRRRRSVWEGFELRFEKRRKSGRGLGDGNRIRPSQYEMSSFSVFGRQSDKKRTKRDEPLRGFCLFVCLLSKRMASERSTRWRVVREKGRRWKKRYKRN
jgi:hypothetical protein